MTFPSIFQKPITAYRERQNIQKIQRQALTSADSLVLTLKFLKQGSTLNLKSSGLGSGKRNWVEKYLHPRGGKAGAAEGLRTFADLQEKYATHPVSQRAAKELIERLPKKNADNQTVKYDAELYELAKRIAHPDQYTHELKTDTLAQTGVISEPIVNQAPATNADDNNDENFMNELDATLSLVHAAQMAAAIRMTNSEVSDSLMDGGRLRFAPTLLTNLPQPPEVASDQRLSDLDKLNYYLDQTNLLDQVGEGDRHGLIEYRSELLKSEEKKQQAL
jgi:hypothetical protein